MATINGELAPEDFVYRALATLTKPGHKGFHPVWSSFNKAFKRKYPGIDPVALTTQMAEDGKIVILPWKGGVLICPQGTITEKQRVEDTLRKMGVA